MVRTVLPVKRIAVTRTRAEGSGGEEVWASEYPGESTVDSARSPATTAAGAPVLTIRPGGGSGT